MINYFAHAGEVHQSAANAATHSLIDQWYIQLPIFVVALCFVVLITYWLSRKSYAVTNITLLIVLFIVGVGSYSKSSAISIFALSLGFSLAFIQVITDLKLPESKKMDGVTK